MAQVTTGAAAHSPMRSPSKIFSSASTLTLPGPDEEEGWGRNNLHNNDSDLLPLLELYQTWLLGWSNLANHLRLVFDFMMILLLLKVLYRATQVVPHFSQQYAVIVYVSLWLETSCSAVCRWKILKHNLSFWGVPFAMHRNHPKKIAATLYGSGANAAVELPLKQRAWHCESRGLPRWALRFQVNSYSETIRPGFMINIDIIAGNYVVYFQDHRLWEIDCSPETSSWVGLSLDIYGKFMLALSTSMEWAMVLASATWCNMNKFPRGVPRWNNSNMGWTQFESDLDFSTDLAAHWNQWLFSQDCDFYRM